MRKAKVESVERIIKNGKNNYPGKSPETLSRKGFENGVLKWTSDNQQASKWDPKSLFFDGLVTQKIAQDTSKTIQNGFRFVRGIPLRPFRGLVQKNDPPPWDSVIQLDPKRIPESVHWRLGGAFFQWFFASFLLIDFLNGLLDDLEVDVGLILCNFPIKFHDESVSE